MAHASTVRCCARATREDTMELMRQYKHVTALAAIQHAIAHTDLLTQHWEFTRTRNEIESGTIPSYALASSNLSYPLSSKRSGLLPAIHRATLSCKQALWSASKGSQSSLTITALDHLLCEYNRSTRHFRLRAVQPPPPSHAAMLATSCQRTPFSNAPALHETKKRRPRR